MSQTLGEKLRQAREEKGISVSEVAEQTRISPLYIESIDNDDYRALPGGIFNRGFVKSYAKYVGVDEQEALSDYARLLYEREGDVEDVKFHRPEVLTDDRATPSMIPTLIVAVIILGLMTGGILFLVSYLRQPATPNEHNTARTSANPANVNSAVNSETNTASAAPTVPDMATVKIEFKALGQPVSLTATIDGRMSTKVVTSGSTEMFEPRERLKLSYSRSLAQSVQLTINGKAITLPTVPLDPKRAAIEFEINKENLSHIWTLGSIYPQFLPAAQDTNANVDQPLTQTAVPNPTTPPAKPSAPASTTTGPSNANRAAGSPRPSATVRNSPRPTANRP